MSRPSLVQAPEQPLRIRHFERARRPSGLGEQRLQAILLIQKNAKMIYWHIRH